MSAGGAVVLLAWVAVGMKVLAFIPDNRWLWRHSAAIVDHLDARADNHDCVGRQALASIERLGLACGQCNVSVPRRPALPAILAGIRPGSAEALPKVVGVCLFPMRTPTLALLVPILMAFTRESRPQWLLTACGFSLVALATTTLLQAPFLRWHLGRYDMDHSDLQSFARFAPRGGRGDEGLAIYFIGLIVVSVLLYAGVYQALSSSTHSIGSASPHRTMNLATWVYFSVITASTLGFGDFYASGWQAQIAVTLQVLTGPLLLFWLISARVVGSRKS